MKQQIRIAPTPIANKWSPARMQQRALKEHKERAKENALKANDLFDLVHTICMTRTSGGRVGVEYPVLRQKLKAFDEKHPTIGNLGWMVIRRHVNGNLTRLDSKYTYGL